MQSQSVMCSSVYVLIRSPLPLPPKPNQTQSHPGYISPQARAPGNQAPGPGKKANPIPSVRRFLDPSRQTKPLSPSPDKKPNPSHHLPGSSQSSTAPAIVRNTRRTPRCHREHFRFQAERCRSCNGLSPAQRPMIDQTFGAGGGDALDLSAQSRCVERMGSRGRGCGRILSGFSGALCRYTRRCPDRCRGRGSP